MIDKGKIKTVSFGLLASLILLIIIYIIGEVTVYSLFRKEIALFPRYVTGAQYNEFKIRKNVTNARYRHKSYDGEWKFRINSHGFRSNVEYSYKKPEGMIRILVLGDSYTLGHEVNQDETYSIVLERKLRDKGFNVEVINAGVSGFSNAEELVFFEQEGIKYQPDILILGFYNNDMIDNVRTNLYGLVNDNLVLNTKDYQPAIRVRDFLNSFFIYRWLSEHSYLHNYLNTVATRYFKQFFLKDTVEDNKKNKTDVKKPIKENNGMQIIIPENGNYDDRYEVKLACKIVERIKSIASENDISFILLDIPLDVPSRRPELYASFPSICLSDDLRTSYVNPVKQLKEFPGSRDELYRPHGRAHWTEQSHLIAGDLLAKFVEKIIKEKPEQEER